MEQPSVEADSKNLDTATFGAGCFWCVEAIFQHLKGVVSVSSGYSGGKTNNPSYEEICKGTTGHAEVVQIIYDNTLVSFSDLLEVFWQTHDPTTINKQGADVGTQYRSVIFYHNEIQKRLAESYKKRLNDSGAFAKPIVTLIEPYVKFFMAENYHQGYYNANKEAPYCSYVIQPKIEKLKEVFKNKIK
jgi:peptide-methionine (S)-S-oxide reductase